MLSLVLYNQCLNIIRKLMLVKRSTHEHVITTKVHCMVCMRPDTTALSACYECQLTFDVMIITLQVIIGVCYNITVCICQYCCWQWIWVSFHLNLHGPIVLILFHLITFSHLPIQNRHTKTQCDCTLNQRLNGK